MTDRPTSVRLVDLETTLVPSPAPVPLVVLGDRPAAPSGVLTCSQTLPRDVLVRLAALARQIADIRQGHAGPPELSLRLEKIAVGLDALIECIYDETVLHYAGRRG